MFSSGQYIELPKETPPQLIVVVDTEEGFDWCKPFDSNNTNINAIKNIGRSQSICDEFAISPCYVIDYPMATNQIAINILKPILDSNRCELGSHLHPWVNPPLTEQVNVKNSFPGNLDFYLEQTKLKILTEQIEKNYGVRPTTYKAGRYGFGNNTLKILQKLGYKTDLSFCPTLNFAEEGGPDYQEFNCIPSWLDGGKQILEVPVSGAFVGTIKHNRHDIYHLADKLKALKVPSILAKTGLLDRLILSPEGFNHKEHIKLTKYLYKHGHRTFTWSFHSPSLEPGFTPYVQNKQQLTKFLDSFRYYFDFFFNEFAGVASTPAKLHEHFRSLH